MTQFAFDSMTGYLWQNVIDGARSGGANWAPYPPAGGTFRIFENRAYCETSGAIYHKTAPPSADYAVQATYWMKTDMSTMSVAGRMQLGALSMYMAYYSGGQVHLAKYVAGALSVLGSEPAAWSTGAHTLRLEMAGTAVGVIWDGDEVIAVSDASITAAGYAGIRSGAPNDAHIGKHIDTFSASDDTTISVGTSRVIGIVGI